MNNKKYVNRIFGKSYQDKIDEINRERKKKVVMKINFIIEYFTLLFLFFFTFITGIISTYMSLKYLNMTITIMILITTMFNVMINCFLIYETFLRYDKKFETKI